MLNESVVEAAALDYFVGLDLSAIKMKRRGKYEASHKFLLIYYAACQRLWVACFDRNCTRTMNLSAEIKTV